MAHCEKDPRDGKLKPIMGYCEHCRAAVFYYDGDWYLRDGRLSYDGLLYHKWCKPACEPQLAYQKR